MGLGRGHWFGQVAALVTRGSIWVKHANAWRLMLSNGRRPRDRRGGVLVEVVGLVAQAPARAAPGTREAGRVLVTQPVDRNFFHCSEVTRLSHSTEIRRRAMPCRRRDAGGKCQGHTRPTIQAPTLWQPETASPWP